jgi:hypothetical protein
MDSKENVQTLRHDFINWTTLKAWNGQYLGQIAVVFTPAKRRKVYTTGLAHKGERIHLTVGTDLNYARATLLHELAHIAVQKAGIYDGHGKNWRGTLISAATEILGPWEFCDERSNISLTREVGRVFDLVEYKGNDGEED